MVKLKTRILDPVPHPSDVKYDTIRPVCLPDYASEDDIPAADQLYSFHQLSDKILFNSRLLTAKKAKITPNDECKSTLSSIASASPVVVQEYVFFYLFIFSISHSYREEHTVMINDLGISFAPSHGPTGTLDSVRQQKTKVHHWLCTRMRMAMAGSLKLFINCLKNQLNKSTCNNM